MMTKILVVSGGSLDPAWAADWLSQRVLCPETGLFADSDDALGTGLFADSDDALGTGLFADSDNALRRGVRRKDSYDRIIAADAGLDSCRALDITPDYIVGDFDSLADPAILDAWEKRGVSVERFPARKDYTDTDLALRLARSFAPGQVDIIGGSGTRLDHTIANVGLLVPMEEAGILCRITDAHNSVEIIKGPSTRTFFQNAALPYLSVAALTPEVKGVTMKGFSYPLTDYTLKAFDSLGISNEITAPAAAITVGKGLLLVIRARD